MSSSREFVSGARPDQIHLRLIATTDLYSHIFAYDDFTDRASGAVGLARTATLIAEARVDAPNTLMLDNGDFLQGRPGGDYMAYERGPIPGTPHPMLRPMAAAGIEVTALGNHEFNYGPDLLIGILSDAPFRSFPPTS